MRIVGQRKHTIRKGLRGGLSLALLLCMLVGLAPAGLASGTDIYTTLDNYGFKNVGSNPDNIVESSDIFYVRLSEDTKYWSINFVAYGDDAVGDLGIYKKGTVLRLRSKQYATLSSGSDVAVGLGTDVVIKGYDTWNSGNGPLVFFLPASACKDIVSDTTSLLRSYWTDKNYVTLEIGMDEFAYNWKVQSLQYALKQTGYLSDTPDGTFGPKTEEAVKKFQAANGLEEDGKAGKATQTSLFNKAQGIVTDTGSSTPSTTTGFTYAGTTPGSISASGTKYYVRVGAGGIGVFSSNEYPSDGKTVWANEGSIMQLLAKQYYTINGVNYARLYFDSKLHNVRLSDVENIVLSEGDLKNYITNSLWTIDNSPLNSEMTLVGDIRVHGVQMALATLGYYTGARDGNFGSGTESSLRSFQRANGLEADGRFGPLTQTVLFRMALAAGVVDPNGANSSSSGGSTGGSSGGTGSLTTTAKVNLRKGASTSTTRMGSVPAGKVLTYTDTSTVNGITWYYVTYGKNHGWLMGTYVNAYGMGLGTGGSGTGSVTGTVTIIKPSTRVRKTPSGSKTGVVLALGSVVSMVGASTTSGGYTWYHVQTPSGVTGYVRGDCATAVFDGGSSGGVGSGTNVTLDTSKTYVKLSKNVALFTSRAKSTTGETWASTGSIIQLGSTYTEGGVQYTTLVFGNKSFNAVYADVSGDIMSTSALVDYITGVLWRESYTYPLKEDLGLVGDIRVHAAQLALKVLGYYTGTLDGNYGSATTSAVRNYQRKNNLDVDGSIGPNTWISLFPAAINGYTGYVDGGSNTGNSVNSGSFGTVTRVQKANWDFANAGIGLLPKQSTAQVMDVKTRKVFTIYRWSGGNHADCVPNSAADTRIMCEIVDFVYNSASPSTSQVQQIKNDSGSSNPNSNYTWPDFSGKLTGANRVSSSNAAGSWDSRPAWLNVNGTVYCVSIYGWPHGFDDAFEKYGFHKQNNYYGMLCIHFSNSKTHGGSDVKKEHTEAIQTAYDTAKSVWPGLVK